jgi:hypothetical protein
MAKRMTSFHSHYVETMPEVDYRDGKTAKRPAKAWKSPHVETKPEVKEARNVRSWADYTKDARFRTNGIYLVVTPELRESIRETVETHFAAHDENDELKRLVETGEITTADEVLAFFDKSISKELALIQRAKEHDFQKSLLSMTPKEKEKAVAVRNLTRAVINEAIARVTTKDDGWADARAVLQLHEQGIGPGGEGVLAKLIAEEKATRGKIDLQRYIPKVVG